MAFKSSLRPKSSRQSISRFLTNEGYTEVQTPPHERTGGGGTKRAWKVPTYAVLMIAQAAVTLALEGYVFGRYTNDLHIPNEGEERGTLQRYAKTIPTFLTLYIFGFIYELLLVVDALKHKNTIQLYGLCICNIGLLVYGAVQIEQIQGAVEVLEQQHAIYVRTWPEINGCLIAIPCVIGAFTICEAFITWSLSSEFLRYHGDTTQNSNYKRRGLTAYQTYMTMLKFDIFFFLGFTIQFVVIVQDSKTAEFAVTVAAIPITILIIGAAVWATIKEIKPLMLASIALFIGGLAYFIFKMVRMYYGPKKDQYESARKSLTFFAAITILLIILTIANACVCYRNFDNELTEILGFFGPKRVKERDTEMGVHGMAENGFGRPTIE